MDQINPISDSIDRSVVSSYLTCVKIKQFFVTRQISIVCFYYVAYNKSKNISAFTSFQP